MFHLNLYLQNPMNEEFNEIAILDVADVFLQSEPTWEDDIPAPSEDYIRDNDYDDNFWSLLTHH